MLAIRLARDSLKGLEWHSTINEANPCPSSYLFIPESESFSKKVSGTTRRVAWSEPKIATARVSRLTPGAHRRSTCWAC